ncbi:MAG: hypothetical protein EOO07_22610 [Chitinophagaceae bacterium]|nr:MAG: hypothetical protein EOO07_22610 [Chitinophagaceae bacterium]
MKNLKTIIVAVLTCLTQLGFSQNLTPPQVQGYQSASTMKTTFPFNIKGVAFTSIPNSVWHTDSKLIAELHMRYYLEGDAGKYMNKVTRITKPHYKNGRWSFENLSIDVTENHRNKALLDEKTSYMLSVFQEYNGVRSAGWYVNLYRVQLKIDKIPNQVKGPKVVPPIDKIILNPQPIPPKEIKKTLKGN